MHPLKLCNGSLPYKVGNPIGLLDLQRPVTVGKKSQG